MLLWASHGAHHPRSSCFGRHVHLSPPAALRTARALQGGEDDIDALLAAFKLKDERHSRVEVQEGCAAPSPRVYASFTPIPSQVGGPGWGGAWGMGWQAAGKLLQSQLL